MLSRIASISVFRLIVIDVRIPELALYIRLAHGRKRLHGWLILAYGHFAG
jgi:hypothetical protein